MRYLNCGKSGLMINDFTIESSAFILRIFIKSTKSQ